MPALAFFVLPCYDNYRDPHQEEVSIVGTEKERKDTKKAMLYDLRLIVKSGDKDHYTREELLDLFDTIAAAMEKD